MQYGADGASLYTQATEKIGSTTGIKISGFGLDQRGLGPYMRLAKTGDGGVEGVVVSHAGE